MIAFLKLVAMILVVTCLFLSLLLLIKALYFLRRLSKDLDANLKEAMREATANYVERKKPDIYE